MSELCVGISIEILRSDGRIHSAVVSAIQANSVTVEWYENGEAKGKEIDLESVFQMNGTLRLPNNNEVSTAPSRYQQQSSPAQQNQAPVSQSAAYAYTPYNQVKPPAQQHVLQQQQQAASHTPPPTGRPSQAAPAASASRVTVANRQNLAHVASAGDDYFASDITPGEEDEDMDGLDVAQAPVGIPKRVRPANKSHVVKEIERIQQKREERRAAQQKIREMPEYDPTNPNYDFLMMIKNFQNTLDYIPFGSNDPVQNHRICVCVRKRPLNKKETTRKEVDVITIPNNNVIYVHEPKLKVDLTKYLDNQQFRFDYAFDESVDNMMVYRYTARPLVESVFEGGMATCFAYGQTGSGKTFTFAGEYEAKKGLQAQDVSNGIYALAAKDVFQLLNTKYKRENLYVEASFFEIYGGKVFDLLNKKQKLRVLEDGQQVVNVVGLKEELVESADDVKRLLQHGNLIRTSGQTSANQHSSRSHAVFQLKLKKRQTRKLHGKFSLIDLAGNERGADTSSSDRATRMEGAEINKSLLCLKECIRALGRKGAHLPFRGSKLTQVLRDSFIGERSRTCMIAMISPGMSSCEHTLNTLRYADRVKELPTTGAAANAENMAPGFPEDMGPPGLDEGDDEDELKACLRSTEDELITDEYLTFQETVAHIEKMEEEVCDEHQTVLDNFEQWKKEHNRLAAVSNEVGYDVEDFAARLDNLLDKEIHSLVALKDKVTAWRKEMHEEEVISNQLKNRKKM